MHFIPNPENKLEVNHKDCDRTNNSLDNLEWMTNKENIEHAIQNGKIIRKLTDSQIIEIRSKYIPKIYTQKMLAFEYRVSREYIRDIINNKERVLG